MPRPDGLTSVGEPDGQQLAFRNVKSRAGLPWGFRGGSGDGWVKPSSI